MPPSDRASVVEALLRFVESCQCPMRVTVDAPGVHGAFDIPPAGPGTRPQAAREGRPPLPRSGCAADIMTVLRSAGRRLTMPLIKEEMDALGMEDWSERSIQRYLAQLKADGWVDHDDQARPSGYGIAP